MTDPVTLSASADLAAWNDAALAREHRAIQAAFARALPPGSGLPPTREPVALHGAVLAVEAEMGRRLEARAAVSSTARHAAAAAAAARGAFARGIAGDPEYRPICDPGAGTDMIGWYWVRNWCDGLFFTQCVPALEKVFDREGHLLWMNEAGMARPLVDPVGVIVGGFVGWSGGAPTFVQWVRGVSPAMLRMQVGLQGASLAGARQIAQRSVVGAAVQGARNDLVRELRERRHAVAIPRSVLGILIARAR